MVNRLRLEPIVRHFGGTRALALPLLRGLAIVLSLAWVLLAGPDAPGGRAADAVAAAFLLYSAVLAAGLVLRPDAMRDRNAGVLVVDLLFAVVLVRLTGGATSPLYPALLLVAGLHGYYYGGRRGLAVGALGAALYAGALWPLAAGGWAAAAVRLAALVGTAVGAGMLADSAESERAKVGALTAAAQARERFISDVVATLHEGVVALDTDARVVAWNGAMQRRYGVPSAEVVGRNFFDFFPSVAREPWGAALARLLRGELEDFTFDAVEHETLRRGRVVQNLKASLVRQDGRPAGAVLLIEDITERVALERSARQAEKLAALGTLAAGVAHEMNNPIGIISSRIELMLLEAESRPLPPDVHEDLRVLHRHAQRVARIASGLLSFARQEPHEQGPVDLNRVVEETLVLVDRAMAKDGVVVRRSLEPGLPTVWGDANGLQQVLMNLLANARDAVAGHGEITVVTEAAGDPPGVRLRVRDTGTGIAPDVIGRIFDPFFTTKPRGTGLGLSISYAIVRDHRGTVDVESAPGRGTTFVVTFPPAAVGAPA